jgi:F-type H+-transporting ATPase subunit delta
MKPTIISGRYAKALAESVADDVELEVVAAELVALVKLFHDRPEFVRFANNRAIPRETRERLLESVLDRVELRPVTRRFLLLLVNRGRIGLLEQISSSFAGLVDRRLNRAEAMVTTAVPLNDEQKERLRSRLSELTGKTIRLEEQRDPGIIGVTIVRLGTTVIDGSIRSFLKNMRKELVGEAQ